MQGLGPTEEGMKKKGQPPGRGTRDLTLREGTRHARQEKVTLSWNRLGSGLTAGNKSIRGGGEKEEFSHFR